MRCKHLYLYAPAGKQWTVASCSCKAAPYVPSMSELEGYCKTGRHLLCPSLLASLPASSGREQTAVLTGRV